MRKREEVKSILRRWTAILISIAVLFTAMPVLNAYASEVTQPQMQVLASSAVAVSGSLVSIGVNAHDFEKVAGLEVSLYYDPQIMTYRSVSAGSMTENAIVDINPGTEGEVKESMICLDGMNGTGDLMTVVFEIKDTVQAGVYSILLTVGDAYDTEFNKLEISKTYGQLEVKSPSEGKKEAIFDAQIDKGTVEEGDSLNYTLSGLDSGDMAGGSFIFYYDASLLQLQDVKTGSSLQTASSLCLINKDAPGYVKVSYADINSISSIGGNEYITLQFQVKSGAQGHTSILFSPEGLVDINLNSIKAAKSEIFVDVTKKEIPKEYPRFWLETEGETSDNGFCVVAKAEGESNIAAGDFVINYNSDHVICTSVEVDESVQSNGGYIVTNENISEGKISFSFLNMEGITTDQSLVKMHFKVLDSVLMETVLTCEGKDVVNAAYEEVLLSYEHKSIKIPRVTGIQIKKEPTKVHYFEGERFCPDGLVITVYYSDGSQKEIVYSEETAGQFAIDKMEPLTANDDTIMIYCSGLSVEQSITVEEEKAVALEIKQSPSKVEYYEGDDFSAEGLVLTVTYNSGKIEEVSYNQDICEAFTFNKTEDLRCTDEGITIGYEGFETIQTIKVNKVEAVRIQIGSSPAQVVYYAGDYFKPEGLTVVLNYNNGTIKEIAYSEETAGQFIFDKTGPLHAGDKGIMIGYGGLHTQQEIIVEEEKCVNIEIKQAPERLEYYEGDDFAAEGLVLKITYNSGKTREIIYSRDIMNAFSFSKTENLTCADKEITIGYEGLEVVQPIVIREVETVGLQIKTFPAKVSYYEGESFDAEGLVVILNYTNGTSKEIAYTEETAVLFYFDTMRPLTVEDNTITIYYDGFSIEQRITVEEEKAIKLAIKRSPTQVEYYEGDNFAAEGLVFAVTYNSGKTEEVVYSQNMKDAFSFSKTENLSCADEKITLGYAGLNVVQSIVVKKLEAVSLQIVKSPVKVTYYEGESFQPEGLVVMLSYNNGSQKQIVYTKERDSEFTFSKVAKLVSSDNSIRITYADVTAMLAITVRKVVAPNNPVDNGKKPLRVGSVIKFKQAFYKVTKRSKSRKEVVLYKMESNNIKTFTIPKSVKANGETYKVTSIGSKAFIGCKKLKKIMIKSERIKKIGKSALKGIYKRAVFICPKKKRKTYKKLVMKKTTGYLKTMRVK